MRGVRLFVSFSPYDPTNRDYSLANPTLKALACGSGSSHLVIPTEMALIPHLFCACQKDRSQDLHNRFNAVSIFTMEKGIAAEKMPFGGQGLSRSLE